jgi:hypothetical protein
MCMSTLSTREITMPPAKWKVVERRAKNAGTTPSGYVASLIDRDLRNSPLDEILRPIREGFRKKGMTEGQLDAIVDRARRATSPSKSRRTSR